jgi:hypothetical protein
VRAGLTSRIRDLVTGRQERPNSSTGVEFPTSNIWNRQCQLLANSQNRGAPWRRQRKESIMSVVSKPISRRNMLAATAAGGLLTAPRGCQ